MTLVTKNRDESDSDAMVRTSDYLDTPIIIQATEDEFGLTTSAGEEATALPVRILVVSEGSEWVETLVFWKVVRDQLKDKEPHLGVISKPAGKRYYLLHDVEDEKVEAQAERMLQASDLPF